MLKKYSRHPTYVRLPTVRSGESTAMTANNDINLYNDNGTLKKNVAGVISTIGTEGANPFDQDLNSTDSPTFAFIYPATVWIEPDGTTRDQIYFSENPTPTQSVGGLNFDGSNLMLGVLVAPGQGTQSSRIPAYMWNYYINDTYTYANSASAQNMFPSDRDKVTLAASTTYEFEIMLYGTKASAGETVSLSFIYGASLGNIRYQFVTGECAVNQFGTPRAGHCDTTSATVIVDSGADTTFFAQIKGLIATVDASDLTPMLTFSTASASKSLRSGSFVKLSAVGATANKQTHGSWY